MTSASSRHARLSAERSASLGAKVRDQRKLADMTQERLASLAGLTPEHLRELELGRANPTLATVFAIVDALNCSIELVLPD